MEILKKDLEIIIEEELQQLLSENTPAQQAAARVQQIKQTKAQKDKEREEREKKQSKKSDTEVAADLTKIPTRQQRLQQMPSQELRLQMML